MINLSYQKLKQTIIQDRECQNSYEISSTPTCPSLVYVIRKQIVVMHDQSLY